MDLVKKDMKLFNDLSKKLKTPAGKPASCIISANNIPESGAISEGFNIIVHPVANAGITFSAI